MSYTLKVNVPTDSIKALKASKYNLCVAKPVDGKYTVVWKGLKYVAYSMISLSSPSSPTNTNQICRQYLNHNNFVFQDKFQLFGTNTFQDGSLASADTDVTSQILQGLYLFAPSCNSDSLTNDVQSGQGITLDGSGTWSGVIGTADSGKPIVISNKYGGIHIGVKIFDGNQYSDIYVSEDKRFSGTINLTPTRKLMVWFEVDVQTGTMFSQAKTNTIEVRFEQWFVWFEWLRSDGYRLNLERMRRRRR
jgi:hypothetical protein